MYELENVINDHLQNVTSPASTSRNVYSGHVDGEEKYQAFLTGLNAAGFSFSTRTSFGDSKSKGRIFFKKNASTTSQYEVSIPFFGSPFQVVKSAHLQCSQGEKYFKSKAIEAVNQELDVPPAKKQRCPKHSKKFGCPAFLSMKCIRVFDEPQYMLSDPGSYGIAKVSDLLQGNLCAGSSAKPTSFLRYHVVVSPSDAHAHPATVGQPLHPRLREEIRRMVREGVTGVKAVRLGLQGAVASMFEGSAPPDPANSCFYPTDKAIRNHVRSTREELKRSRFDGRNLERLAESWRRERPDERLLFRPGGNGVNGRPATLFCHQTRWQGDLLDRYGDSICLLDPAYKTARYPLPLFFLVVKTNCGYSVAGTFVVYDETSASVAEALAVFASWNPDWDPRYFMTDFAEEQVEAVREAFPRTTAYVCDFHREQTWDRWLEKIGRVSGGDERKVKKLWRDVATSISEGEYQANLVVMNDNKTYKQCPLARHHFAQRWLVCRESWVLAYQAADFLSALNTNDGVAAQKKALKHSFLRFCSNKTASGILRIIVEEFLPQALNDYRVGNARPDVSPGDFDEETLEFLRDKTRPFVERFAAERGRAIASYDIDKIIDMSGADSEALFYVKSDTEECYYVTDLGAASCTCQHFARWRFPCAHMCALFLYTGWSFDGLPAAYRESPYVNVHPKYSEAGAGGCQRGRGSNVSAGSPTETGHSGADLLEARERLKRILGHSYRMEEGRPSTSEFCRRVADLETDTLESLSRLEAGGDASADAGMPPLQLLRKRYTEPPAGRRTAAASPALVSATHLSLPVGVNVDAPV